MNRESVNLRRLEYPLPAGTEVRPGDFCWEPNFSHIYLCLPGETHLSAIKVCKGTDPKVERVWVWDGNVDAPTLTPSILLPDLWHGYLRAGRLESD
jgi:hypothetical protein